MVHSATQPALLTGVATAKLLGIDRKTLYRWTRLGLVNAEVRLTRGYRYAPSEVERVRALMAANAKGVNHDGSSNPGSD